MRTHRPCNERLLLSSIMLVGGMPASLRSLETDFSDPRCAVVFRAMFAVQARQESLSITTVAAELEAQETLDLVGGMTGLCEIAGCFDVSTHTLAHYDAVVVRAAERRRIASLARDLAQAASEGEEDALDYAYGRLVREWENQTFAREA